MINLFLKNNFDIVTNVFPKHFLADNRLKSLIEIVFLIFLQINLIKVKRQRTKYFYENKKFYNILNVTCDYSHSNIKLSVDTLDDFGETKEKTSLTEKLTKIHQLTKFLKLE